jgi:hypothetical protein
MHRYQVAKYVIFNSEKIFVKKFPWMLKYFLYTILLLGFISTQCLIDMTPITV